MCDLHKDQVVDVSWCWWKDLSALPQCHYSEKYLLMLNQSTSNVMKTAQNFTSLVNFSLASQKCIPTFHWKRRAELTLRECAIRHYKLNPSSSGERCTTAPTVAGGTWYFIIDNYSFYCQNELSKKVSCPFSTLHALYHTLCVVCFISEHCTIEDAWAHS